MSSIRSKYHTRSPSFPSGQVIQEDIFFQVKKQILDKLDIILQKINLEVIEYLKRENEIKQQKPAFKFIELSSFEIQIQTLFDYLDRLYLSLNSSISFSSNDIRNTIVRSNSYLQSNKSQAGNKYGSHMIEQITALKKKCSQLEEQNFRVKEQNEHIKFVLKNSSTNHSISLTQSLNQQSKKSLKGKSEDSRLKSNSRALSQENISLNKNGLTNSKFQGISLQTVRKILRFYNHSIRQLSLEYKEFGKQIKRLLKQLKFQIVQNRVQSIANLKKWTQKIQNQLIKSNSIRQLEQIQRKNLRQQKIKQGVEQNCGQNCHQQHLSKNREKNQFQQQILNKIQQILDVC